MYLIRALLSLLLQLLDALLQLAQLLLLLIHHRGKLPCTADQSCT